MNVKILFVLTLVFFSYQLTAQDEFTLTKEGQAAPDFIFEPLEGSESRLSDAEGKIVWITFFATWCGPCRKELPYLEKQVYQKYKNNPNFRLLVIGREHSRDELEKFRKETGLDLPFIPDPKREIFKKYAAQNIPRNFIVDERGNIAVSSVGFNVEDFDKKVNKLEELLDSLKK